MGNSIVRDFNNVELGHGTLPNKDAMIAPGSVVLDEPMTVLVRHDDQGKSTIFFDFSTMLPLYVSTTKTVDANTKITVTKDSKGRILFLTSYPTKGKRLIFRAPKNLTRSPSTRTALASLTSSSSNDPLHSNHSEHSASGASVVAHAFVEEQRRRTNTKNDKNSNKNDTDVPCAAQIDVDRSGATVTAFLSVVVWKGSGPELLSVYKAVQIPKVKYGALVLDMQGQVVGKSFLDDRRMQPKIQVAAGTDVPSVVALASALLGEL